MQEPVQDMTRALADMVARYHAVPTEIRQASLEAETQVRRQLEVR